MEDISQIYFFNNNYDDELICDKLVDFRESTYFQSLKLQESVPNCQTFVGKMSDFKLDKLLNNKYGIGNYAYTAIIRDNIIPKCNQDEYFHTYGGKIISTFDFMKSPIISRNIIFQIDKYYFFLLRFYIDTDKTILIIYPDANLGLTEDFIKDAIKKNYQWTLTLTPQVEFMYTYRIKTSLFNDNKIGISKFDSYFSIGKPEAVDTWNMYLSCDTNNLNLLVSTEVRYDSKSKSFIVDSRFKNYIFSKITNCKCFLINSYQRVYSSIINKMSMAKVQIPVFQNPIHPNNINIWEYDELNAMKLKRVNEKPLLSYPCIYDFTEIYKNHGTIYIEYCHNPLTQTHFDNNLKLYLDYNKNYLSNKENGNLPEKIKSYSPLEKLDISFADYKENNYKDIRQYKLDKLKVLLKDNPLRYKRLYQELTLKNRNSIIFSFTKNDYLSVWNTRVLDTKTINSNLDFVFDEPHTYVEFNNSIVKNRSIILFIDGRRRDITAYKTVGRIMYIFFKASLINDSSDITIEISNAPSIRHLDTVVNFSSITDIQEFPFTHERVSGLNLAYALKENSGFIPNDNIQYYYDAYRYVTEEGDILELESIAEYYGTIDKKIYAPLESSMYRLEDKMSQIFSPYNFAKYVNVANLKFSVLDSDLIGKDIIVYNADVYRKLYSGEINLEETISIKLFKGERNHNRIRVYIDGVLLKRGDYTFEFPSYYRGTAKLTIHSVPDICTNMECIVDYLPYVDKQLFNGIPSEIIYRNGVFFLYKLTNKPLSIDKMKIYVNGERISKKKIKELPVNDAFIIDGYHEGDRLQIFIDKDDPDCYGYEDNKKDMIITDTVYNDEDFIENLK